MRSLHATSASGPHSISFETPIPIAVMKAKVAEASEQLYRQPPCPPLALALWAGQPPKYILSILRRTYLRVLLHVGFVRYIWWSMQRVMHVDNYSAMLPQTPSNHLRYPNPFESMESCAVSHRPVSKVDVLIAIDNWYTKSGLAPFNPIRYH